MTIKAVVFDMDGVILDSRQFITEAIESVLAERGLATTPEQMAAVTGKPIRAMYEVFAPGHDAGELEAAHLRHHDANLHLLRAYDKAAEALEALKRAGYKIGMFTGCDDAMAHDRLTRFELLDYFDAIFGVGQYTRHKPDPEGLLMCLEALGCRPDEAVYIGDGAGDMQAGTAAQVQATIGITHGFGSRTALQQAGADYLIDALTELPELVAHIAGR